MQKDTTLLIGDKISITVDGRHFYKTTIGDIYRNGLILIGAPIYRETQMQLHLFDEIYLVFYRESGRYITQVRVVDFQVKDEVRYSILEQLTIPEKDQRREFYRLPTNISVEALLCEYTEGMELTLSMRDDVNDAKILAEARTRDISVTGTALITNRLCRLSENYLLKLYFDGAKGKKPPFLICTKVRRSELTLRGDMYDVGMQFFGLTKNKSEFLTRYILVQQQQRIVKRKLIEEE